MCTVLSNSYTAKTLILPQPFFYGWKILSKSKVVRDNICCSASEYFVTHLASFHIAGGQVAIKIIIVIVGHMAIQTMSQISQTLENRCKLCPGKAVFCS